MRSLPVSSSVLCASVGLFISTLVYISVNQPFTLFLQISICLLLFSVFLFVRTSVCLSVELSVCLTVIYLFVPALDHLSTHLSDLWSSSCPSVWVSSNMPKLTYSYGQSDPNHRKASFLKTS